jgi:hypothetical protein
MRELYTCPIHLSNTQPEFIHLSKTAVHSQEPGLEHNFLKRNLYPNYFLTFWPLAAKNPDGFFIWHIKGIDSICRLRLWLGVRSADASMMTYRVPPTALSTSSLQATFFSCSGSILFMALGESWPVDGEGKREGGEKKLYSRL